MNCNEARELKHAYFDGELDLVRSLQIEEHLKGCVACAQANENLQGLRSALRSQELYFRAPAGLERRIRSTLRHENAAESPGASLLAWFWLRAAGIAVVVALLAWGIVIELRSP